MAEQIYGNIHSLEYCGTVDGPGIRFVVFMQGCPMRCEYCHNPDSWTTEENKKMSAKEILEKYEGVKEFLRNGGLTVTGGEPLMQIEFVTELFKQAKEKQIHTALDTSGILFNRKDTSKVDELLQYTDLVMLDIKHIDDNEHKKLTGHSNINILDFAKYLSEKNIPVWIRHVIVPTINLDEDDLIKTREFIDTLNNVERVDVLPYHTLGVHKYKELGLKYPLEGVRTPTSEEIKFAKEILGDK